MMSAAILLDVQVLYDPIQFSYSSNTVMSIRNAHYQTGNTPLALVWKDENCSQYVLDTDSKGQVPSQQQVHSYFMSLLP